MGGLPLGRERAGASSSLGPFSCSYSRTSERNCPKSLGYAREVGLREANKGPLGPFDRPYTALIHALSVAPNPFSESFSKLNSAKSTCRKLHSPDPMLSAPLCTG